MHQLLTDLRSFELTKNCFAFGDKHHISISKTDLNNNESVENVKTEIIDFLTKKGHSSLVISQIEPGIEDCFMQLSQNN